MSMPENNLEELKKEMEELSVDFVSLTKKFDEQIKTAQARLINAINENQVEFNEALETIENKEAEGSFTPLIEKEINKKPKKITITDLEAETNSMLQALNLSENKENTSVKTKNSVLDLLKNPSYLKENIGNIKELSLKESVKPKAKCKKKSRKEKEEEEKWNKSRARYKCLFAACTLSGALITAPAIATILNHLPPKESTEVDQDSSLTKLKKEALQEYKEDIFDPNTNPTVHSHDIIEMMCETAKKYEDPIVGFYLAYQNLDDWCKKYKIEDFMYKYNLVYQTNYLSVENFLETNQFQDMSELENYALGKLKEEELEEGRGL